MLDIVIENSIALPQGHCIDDRLIIEKRFTTRINLSVGLTGNALDPIKLILSQPS